MAIPFQPFLRFTNPNLELENDIYLQFNYAGTSNLAPIYTDSAESSEITNPHPLTANGVPTNANGIWTGNVNYDIFLLRYLYTDEYGVDVFQTLQSINDYNLGVVNSAVNYDNFVDTIADLKALDAGSVSVVNVAGYHAEGDGGGGIFVYNASSTESDNGGTIIAPNTGSGRYYREFKGYVTTADFGDTYANVDPVHSNINNAGSYAFENSIILRFLSGTHNIESSFSLSCQCEFDVGALITSTNSSRLTFNGVVYAKDAFICTDKSYIEMYGNDETNAKWFRFSESASDEYNGDVIDYINSHATGTVLITEGSYSVSSCALALPCKIMKGCLLTSTGTVTFQGNVDIADDCIRSDGFVFYNKYLSLRWFYASTTNADLTNAHSCAVSRSNIVVIDRDYYALSSYTQSGSVQTKIPVFMTVTGDCELSEIVESDSASINIGSVATLTISNNVVHANWFVSFDDALSCAQSSGALLDGDNNDYSVTSTLYITSNQTIRNVNLSSTVQMFSCSTDVVVFKLDNVIADSDDELFVSMAKSDNSLYITNSNITGGILSVGTTKLVNCNVSITHDSGYHSLNMDNCYYDSTDFALIIESFSSLNNSTINALKILVLQTSEYISAVSIVGCKIAIVYDSVTPTDTGYIEIGYNGTDTIVNGLLIKDNTFYGLSDIVSYPIRKDSGTTFNSTATSHRYEISGNITTNANMVLLQTEYNHSTISDTVLSSETIHTAGVDLTGYLMEFSGDYSQYRPFVDVNIPTAGDLFAIYTQMPSSGTLYYSLLRASIGSSIAIYVYIGVKRR